MVTQSHLNHRQTPQTSENLLARPIFLSKHILPISGIASNIGDLSRIPAQIQIHTYIGIKQDSGRNALRRPIFRHPQGRHVSSRL
jgi:hypothetical protein